MNLCKEPRCQRGSFFIEDRNLVPPFALYSMEPAMNLPPVRKNIPGHKR